MASLRIINKYNILYAIKFEYDYSPLILMICKFKKLKILSIFCSLVNDYRYYGEQSVLCISNEIRDSILKLTNMLNPTVVTNRVFMDDLKEYKPPFVFSKDKINIVRVTQFNNHYFKSNCNLLNILKEISSNYHLYLVGSGRNQSIEKLKNYFLGYEENFTIINTNSSDLLCYICHSNIVVGTGRTAIDALFYNKPLIIPHFNCNGFALFESANAMNLIYNNLSGRNLDPKSIIKFSTCLSKINSKSFKSLYCKFYKKIFLSTYSDKNLSTQLSTNLFKENNLSYTRTYLYCLKYFVINITLRFRNLLIN